jgi:cobalt/nickel transport system permease protein
MHIPDGFLDAKTSIIAAALAIVGVGWAARVTRRTLPRRKIPLLGLAAAFVFAAQMLNFPVAGGTSGHLVGGMLAAVLLGPSAAVLVMTSVLIVQSLMLADGGVLVLGANIFNMAIIGVAGGYPVYWLLRRLGTGLQAQLMAAGFAAWCSVVFSAASCAVQLAVSHTAAFDVVLPAMTGIHMLIGIGEAIITVLVLSAIAQVRPDLLDETGVSSAKLAYTGVLVYGLLISVGLAVLISPIASSLPDGLERVSKKLGFSDKALNQPVIPAPIPDYKIPGIKSPVLATAAAGAIGTVLMFGLSYLLARALTKRTSNSGGPST